MLQFYRYLLSMYYTLIAYRQIINICKKKNPELTLSEELRLCRGLSL